MLRPRVFGCSTSGTYRCAQSRALQRLAEVFGLVCPLRHNFETMPWTSTPRGEAQGPREHHNKDCTMNEPRQSNARHKERSYSFCAALAMILAMPSGMANAAPAGVLAASPDVLSTAEASAKDNFGAAVAIDGNRMAVGAHRRRRAKRRRGVGFPVRAQRRRVAACDVSASR